VLRAQQRSAETVASWDRPAARAGALEPEPAVSRVGTAVQVASSAASSVVAAAASAPAVPVALAGPGLPAVAVPETAWSVVVAVAARAIPRRPRVVTAGPGPGPPVPG